MILNSILYQEDGAGPSSGSPQSGPYLVARADPEETGTEGPRRAPDDDHADGSCDSVPGCLPRPGSPQLGAIQVTMDRTSWLMMPLGILVVAASLVSAACLSGRQPRNNEAQAAHEDHFSNPASRARFTLGCLLPTL